MDLQATIFRLGLQWLNLRQKKTLSTLEGEAFFDPSS